MGPNFGLEGFVKVKPFSGEIDHFTFLKSVTLRQDGKEKTWDIAEVAPRGNFLLIRFAGINSPEAARLLGGAEIIVDREQAAPLKEGEYYVEDLKGLEVINTEGQVFGHIADLLEGGGGQMAEVLLLSGEKRLAPFRKEFFGEIDFSGGKIVLLEPWILDG